jgi:uncharacterized protein (DUF1499 family)
MSLLSMKTALIILIFFFFTFIIYFFILGINSRSKDATGLIEGHLSKCPDTPNCVCTEIKDHTDHYISPIALPQNTQPAFDSLFILKNIVKNMGGSIKVENKNYIAATFSSSIFGFVDDLEIRMDNDQKVIHLRSASRVGRSDMGVNKKRIELIKQRYKKITVIDKK